MGGTLILNFWHRQPGNGYSLSKRGDTMTSQHHQSIQYSNEILPHITQKGEVPFAQHGNLSSDSIPKSITESINLATDCSISF